MIGGWQRVVGTLRALEDELKDLALWSGTAPSVAALASQQPFCVDTLDFSQWLQWVFIPRMTAIAAAGGPVPAGCEVLPMGEEAFAHLGRSGHGVLTVLARIDTQVNALAR